MTHTITVLASKSFFKYSDISALVATTNFLQPLSILLYNNYVEIDYFGLELENKANFTNEEMQKKIDRNIFININFESEKIDYNAFSEKEILNLAISLFDSHKESSMILYSENDINIIIKKAL